MKAKAVIFYHIRLLPCNLPISKGVLALLTSIVFALIAGCAKPPSSPFDLKQAKVTLGPVLELLHVQTGKDLAKLIPDATGQIHVLIASKSLEQVLHVTVRDNQVSTPKLVKAKVTPSQIDGAFDRKGNLHALIDMEHMVFVDGEWRLSEQTPWAKVGIKISEAMFIPGAPKLVWSFQVSGGDVGSPRRMDIYGFGGVGGGIIWPWFTRGYRFVLTTEDHPDCWNVFELSRRFDTNPIALTSDVQGNIYVIYSKSLGGLLETQEDKYYLTIAVQELAPDAAKHPEGMPFQIQDRTVLLQNVTSDLKIPGRDRSRDKSLAVDPESGIMLVDMNLLVRGNLYKELRSPFFLSRPLVAPAGKNAFHAVYLGPSDDQSGRQVVYSLLSSDPDWSAPLQLGFTQVAGFWGSYWNSLTLASTGNGGAFVTWPVAGGIVGRWIKWETPPTPLLHNQPNKTLAQYQYAFDPVHVTIEQSQSEQKPQHQFIVKITDSRRVKQFKRMTIGEMPMSEITIYPDVPDLVRSLLETKGEQLVSRLKKKQPETVECEIVTFDIATPATILYWDITAKIELSLRVHGWNRTVSAQASERTFLWPSKEIITRVVKEMLRQIEEDSERTLQELLAPSGKGGDTL